jgi:hypothetical protein
MVVVVTNASKPSLSLKNRPRESKLQPSITMVGVVSERPWKDRLHYKGGCGCG